MSAPRPLLPVEDWPDWPRSILDLEDPHAIPPEAYAYGDRDEPYSPPRAEGQAYVIEQRAAGLVIEKKFIVLKYSGKDYRIALSRIGAEADLLAIVCRLAGKPWMNADRLRYFIERVSFEVLGIEATP